MGRGILVLLGFLVAGLDQRASSQAVPGPPSLEDQINAASRILVRTATGRGELSRPRLAGDSLTLTTGWMFTARSGLRTTLAPPLPLSAVSEIAVPAGTNAAKGALIGGGIGALFGLVPVVGAAAGSSNGFSLSGGEYAAAVAVTTFLSAGIGALLGATSTKWRVVYPAPTEPR